MYRNLNRRQFAVATAAGLAGAWPVLRADAAEPPPETRTIRIMLSTAVCLSPLFVSEAHLRAEGFEDIEFVEAAGGYAAPQLIGGGKVDFGMTFAGSHVHWVDEGEQVIGLAGVHSGCYELFAHPDRGIRTISDLEGKRVGIQTFAASAHLYVSTMAVHVGLDPKIDIEWITNDEGRALDKFAAGETDAFLAFAPEPQELRARGVGQVILNTATDRPWAQYLCCILYGNRDWVAEHPVATKRALRAFLKTADFCETEPRTAARQLVDRGFFDNYDFAAQALEEIPYTRWREFDAEDTIRFFALRLHEAGMLRSTPQEIVEASADWRYFEELKQELKI
jgi:NitT/TauT family transport system substrate-binding protein